MMIQVANLHELEPENMKLRTHLTSEKKLLGGVEETVLSLSVGDRVETTDAHDFPNYITTTIVCIAVCPKNAAKVRL